MSRGFFMLCVWMGVGAALAVFFLLKAKRIAFIPSFVWWLCIILGIAPLIYGLMNSTTPSFANRITAVGKTYDYTDRQAGRDTFHGFRFVPDAGKPIYLETTIILPGWGDPAVFNGRIFRVIYVEGELRAMRNEAVDIEILSGRDAGYHRSVDARPFGAWLGIPFGAALASFGVFGLKYKKNGGANSAAPEVNASLG